MSETWTGPGVETPASEQTVAPDGTRIAYRRWAARGEALGSVVLIHGATAWSRWWEPVARHLVATHDVVAVDLAGHGDSGRRVDYGLESWADDVEAVIADARLRSPAIIGHSMGGFVAVATNVRRTDLGATIVIDPSLSEPVRDESGAIRLADAGRQRAMAAPKVYPDREVAAAKFRLVPAQPIDNPEQLRAIGWDSLRPVDGGWTWHYDPAIFTNLPDGALNAYIAERGYLERLVRPVAFLRCADSAVTDPAMLDYVRATGGPGIATVELAGAHHHVLLEQPAALARNVTSVLAAWRSTPKGE